MAANAAVENRERDKTANNSTAIIFFMVTLPSFLIGQRFRPNRSVITVCSKEEFLKLRSQSTSFTHTILRIPKYCQYILRFLTLHCFLFT